MSSPLRAVISLAAGVLSALTLSVPAQAHLTPVHWIQLTPGTSSSVYPTTFTGHSGFQLQVTAYFGQVTSGSAFLERITFRLYDIQPGGILGGPAYIWNSNKQLNYDADRSTVYYSPTTYTLDVNQWFIGGGPGNRIALTLEKNNNVELDWHRSQVTFHVP